MVNVISKRERAGPANVISLAAETESFTTQVNQ